MNTDRIVSLDVLATQQANLEQRFNRHEDDSFERARSLNATLDLLAADSRKTADAVTAIKAGQETSLRLAKVAISGFGALITVGTLVVAIINLVK